MPTVADLKVVYSGDTSGADAAADKVNSSIGKVGKTAALVGAAAGVAIGGFLANSVNAAANFEQGMSGVAASLGGVGTAGGITEQQFKALNDEALRIGQTTSVGATDAARAMDLLAKAGVSTESIINGTAQAVVNVSEATGESIDQSASSLGSLSNLFASTGISGSEMADVIVNAMNSSDATLSEFQTGVANLAPVIAGTGMEFDEAAGLISYFNSQGMAAAKVGSSLNSMYMNLVNPTNDMIAAQQALGIQVYDTNGQFVGIPEVLDQVRTATEGMTDAQRDAWITQLFGAEALDVVTMALEGQEGALEDHIGAMDESGAAATAAATRMDNLKGDLEGLKGAFETLSIKVGQAFIPALRTATQALTGFLTGGMKFVEELKLMYDTGNAFTEQWIRKFPSWAQPVVRAIVGIHEAFEDVIDAFQDLRRGDFAGAWREIQEAAQTAFDAISQFAGVTLDWVLDTGVPAITGWVVDHAADVWSGIKTLAGWTWDNRAELGNITLAGTVSLGSEIISNLRSAIDTVIQSVRGFIEGHKSEIDSAISRLFDFNTTGLSGQALGERFGDWLNGLDWGGLFGSYASISAKFYDGVSKAILAGVTLLAGIAGQVGAFIGGFVVGMFERIEWGRLTSLIGNNFRQVFDGASARVQESVQKISDYLGRELSRAGQAVSTALGPAKTAIDNVSTAAGNGVTLVKNLITEGFDKLTGVGANVQAALEPVIAAITAISDAAKAAIGWLDKLTFWNNQNSGGDGSGRTPREQNEMTAPGSGYVTPNNTGEAVNLPGGGYITNLPNVGSGTTAIFNQVQQMAQQVTQAMSQFANAVRTGVAQATAALNPMGAAFTATGARVTAATTQMSAQVRAQVTAMVAQVRAQFTAFQASTAATMTAIQAATTATVTALVAQVNAQFAQMTAQATAQANQMRGSVQAAMQGMAAAGQSAMSQFASAVQSGFSQAAAAAQSGVAAIRGAVNSIGSLYGQGFSIGSSFGQGVAAGLYSMLGAVQAAASAIVAAAAQAAAAKAQIASPSRLMRDQIGVPLAQGVIVGLDSQRNNVASAFANMLPVDARLGRGFTPSSGMGRSANHAPVQNITIYALKSDEYARLLRQAERGNTAYEQIGGRARETALGPSRRV